MIIIIIILGQQREKQQHIFIEIFQSQTMSFQSNLALICPLKSDSVNMNQKYINNIEKQLKQLKNSTEQFSKPMKHKLQAQIDIYALLNGREEFTVQKLWNKYFLQPTKFNSSNGPLLLTETKVLVSYLLQGLYTLDDIQVRNKIQKFEFDYYHLLNPFNEWDFVQEIFKRIPNRPNKYSIKIYHQRNSYQIRNTIIFYYKFSYTQTQVADNNLKILETIFKYVIGLRLLQSFKSYTQQCRRVNRRFRRYGMEYCKFINAKKIHFILDFQKFTGDIQQWSSAIGTLCLQLLQRIQKNFNVQFQFYCKLKPDIYEPRPIYINQVSPPPSSQQQSQAPSISVHTASTLMTQCSFSEYVYFNQLAPILEFQQQQSYQLREYQMN